MSLDQINPPSLESFNELARRWSYISRLLQTKSWVATAAGDKFLSFNKSELYYIRPCYEDIYKIICEKFQGPKPNKVQYPQLCILITGTPGIGKSVFGEILCAVISERRKPALLFYENTKERHLKMVWQKKVFHVSHDEANDVINTLLEDGLVSELAHEDDVIEIWSIGDTTLPVHDPRINRIVITSPGQARVGGFAAKLKEWAKGNSPLKLVVPPCTWEEMLNMRLAWGKAAECSIETLQERFDLWGGVPRNILGSQYLSSSIADQEFQHLTIADAVRYIATYELDHRSQSGKLFRLLPAF
jgi:hypothetical protein